MCQIDSSRDPHPRYEHTSRLIAKYQGIKSKHKKGEPHKGAYHEPTLWPAGSQLRECGVSLLLQQMRP